MSHLSKEGAQAIIAFNRTVLYHLPKRYKYLHYYLDTSLRDTLLSVYKYVNKKVSKYIIEKHRYCFILPNRTLTRTVRKKGYGLAISNRHMNLLCAIGFFYKLSQDQDKETMLDINIAFLEKNSSKGLKKPINAYYFRRYKPEELEKMEANAKRLALSGVTASNFSQNMLVINGMRDIAAKALPSNNKNAPKKKRAEYAQMKAVMEFLINEQGYFTKDDLKANMELSDTEIDKLLIIFKNDMQKKYTFKRPNKEQIAKFGLTSLKYIFTNKGECEE